MGYGLRIEDILSNLCVSRDLSCGPTVGGGETSSVEGICCTLTGSRLRLRTPALVRAYLCVYKEFLHASPDLIRGTLINCPLSGASGFLTYDSMFRHFSIASVSHEPQRTISSPMILWMSSSHGIPEENCKNYIDLN